MRIATYNIWYSENTGLSPSDHYGVYADLILK